jgi:hypothetical protein
MKIEDLFNEASIRSSYGLGDITAIYTLNRDVRDIIEEIAEKYSSDINYSRNSVIGLVTIAINTKDKDAVMEAIKTIRKYDEDAANGISLGLWNVTKYTKDKDRIIKAAKMMSLDEIVDSVKNNKIRYTNELLLIGAYTEDRDAVMESIKMVLKYKGDDMENIAYTLMRIAEYTKDKDRIIKAAKIMRSLDKIVSSLENYHRKLIQIAAYTEDRDAVIESIKTISRYGGDTAQRIASGLSSIAEYTKDKDRIIKAAKMMSLDEIVDSVKNIVHPISLVKIAAYTEDKDAVMESIKTLRRYEGDTAKEIGFGLSSIVQYTKDKDALMEAIKTIRRYYGDTAQRIASELSSIAEYTRDGSALITTCRITNLVGIDVFDLLTGKDFIDIKNKKFDYLIDSKESFDAVAAYIKSGYELPIPSKDSINNYKNIASEYMFNKYGIKRNLNANQLLMFFSVDRFDKKNLVDLINKSNETGLKMYNINTKEIRRIEFDKNKLPYLSIIAVTGSRDSVLDKEAYERISEIVGEKTVRKARNEFNSHYKNKIQNIASYTNRNEIDKAIKYLKAIKNQSIEEVLIGADYNYFGFTGGNTILRAVESNNPLDYDNRVQIACVYLPQNYHNGIYNYCKDYYSEGDRKGFTLVRYNLGGKALGSAICYMEKNNFLVDSIEGHRGFRKEQIFKAVYQDLLDRAREKDAKTVIFSENGLNETPRKFIEFLGSLGLKKGSIKMKLSTKGYLEAEKSAAKGYIVNFE